MPEAILERLQGYHISDSPTEQALADIITMLCMRPAEVTTLHIVNGHVTKYAKGRGINKCELRKFHSMEKDEKRACELLTWIQKAITNGTLRDSGIPGIKWFNSFLKPYGRYCLGGDAFTASGESQTFGGGRLHADARPFDFQNLRDSRLHGVSVRTDFRPLTDDGDIHMIDDTAFGRHQ